MQTTLEVAGIPVLIRTEMETVPVTWEPYLTGAAPVFSVTTTEEDIAAEQEYLRRESAYEGRSFTAYGPTARENTAVYRKIAQILPDYDAFVFHGAAVAVGDSAYLFTAPSGTGKTTHIRLWLQHIDGSFVVNGDKPVLRIIDGTVCVCGTPWMGKEKMGCRRIVPLKGLCLLERGTENRLYPLTPAAALPRMIGQAYRPPEREALKKTLTVLEAVVRKVPLYRLTCTPEKEAAFVAYRGMCGM